MRRIVVALAVLIAACATVGEPPAFAPNQVWTLKDPPSPEMRLVVDGIQANGDRTVIRYSVVMLPPADAFAAVMGLPPEAPAEAHEAFEQTMTRTRGGRGAQYRVSSMFLDEHWRSGSVAIRVPGPGGTGVLDDAPLSQISHFATYDTVLRPALGTLTLDTPPVIFGVTRDAEGAIELMFPEEREEVLSRPLPAMLAEVEAWWRGEQRPDPRLLAMATPSPTPPTLPAADETPVEDPTLDALCRAEFEIDLDTSFEEAERRLNERRVAAGVRPLPSFPDFEWTFHNVTISQSEEWGTVWRAERTFEDLQDGLPFQRVRCWRDEAGAIRSAAERPNAPETDVLVRLPDRALVTPP
jgi:hypothetical protein